jgi:hypothetical protein
MAVQFFYDEFMFTDARYCDTDLCLFEYGHWGPCTKVTLLLDKTATPIWSCGI